MGRKENEEMMNKKKLTLLASCIGVSSIAVALVLTANHMYSGAFGLGLQNSLKNANTTSKTFTLNLGTEHTFDSNNKATEYALNENAGNYGVEFSLTKVSDAADAMSIVNGKTQVREGDTIENVVALSGVTSITVNGGDGNFHLFAGYDKSAMFEFLMSESNGGTRIYNNIPNCNYFKLVGKYDNYDTLISSIDFTYTATGSTCNYGAGVEAEDITVKKGTYKKYAGGVVQHEIVVESNALLVDDSLFSFAHIVYNNQYLYAKTTDQTLLVSYSGNDLVVVNPRDTSSNINGTYVIPQEASAVNMFVNGNAAAENSAASRMNVTVGDTFTFSATSNAVPAETVSVEFTDETGTEPVPGVGTYTPKSTMTVEDIYATWEGGDTFELEIEPIVVTKEGEDYFAQYTDHGYGDYVGTDRIFKGAMSNSGVLSFDDPDWYLAFDINTNTNKLSWTYIDEDNEFVYAMGDVNCNFASAGGATATFDNGTVSVLAVGDFHLTATAGNGVSATLYFHANAYVPATVSVNESSKELLEGETYQINASVNNDATNKTLSYSSNKTSVATVSNTGLVTAKGEGTAVITVTTVDGNSATVTVTVNPLPTTVYTYSDDIGSTVTVTVIDGVSIVIEDGFYNELHFNFNSVDNMYHYEDDEYCILAIRKSDGKVYLDYADDNGTLFGFTVLYQLDTTGSIELTLA